MSPVVRFAWAWDGSAWRSEGDDELNLSSTPGVLSAAPLTPSSPGARSVTLWQLTLASLFTDAPVAGAGGGWWADAFDPGVDADVGPVGSRIWTRLQVALSDQVVELVRQDATDALAWMVEAGMALPSVVVSRPAPRQVALVVELRPPPFVSARYAYLWEVP